MSSTIIETNKYLNLFIVVSFKSPCHWVKPNFMDVDKQSFAGMKLGFLLAVSPPFQRQVCQGGRHTKLGSVARTISRDEVEDNSGIKFIED